VSLRWLEEEGATGDALTDAGGEARFAGLAAGRYAYRVRAPGRPELVSATPIGLEEGERKRHVVRVAGAALSISGRVGDRAGEPLPGIEVSVVRHRYASPVDEAVTTPDRRTWTQEDGAYTLRGLAEGEYEVRTTATLRYASAKAIVRAGAESADLVLLEGLRVHGVVTDAGGARLDRVYVALVPPRDRFAYTDDEGRYQLDLQRGQAGEGLTFRFAKQGYEERQLALPALAGEVRLDAELVLLEDAAPVSGVVLTERGEPVAGATVLLRSRELGTQYQTVSDHNGRFSMPAVKVGPGYGLNVLPNSPLRDYTRARLRVTEEGLELEIALETVETGRLTGRMVDVEENPLPQLRLWLASTTGTRSALPLASDARGEFVVDEAPAGALAFDTRSSPRLSVSGLRLPAGQERDVVLVLDWGEHVLEGQVLDDRGRPVAGAQATLAWSHQRGSLSSRSRRQAVTDGSGAFRFVQLGPGRHALEVHASGFRVAREKLDVDRYAAEVEIRLEPSPE